MQRIGVSWSPLCHLPTLSSPGGRGVAGSISLWRGWDLGSFCMRWGECASFGPSCHPGRAVTFLLYAGQMARSLPCTPASWAEPAGAPTAHRQGWDPWEEELEVAGVGHSPLGSAGHTGSVRLSLMPDTAGVGSPGAEPGLALSARLASGLRRPSSPSSSSHLPPLLPACSSPFFLPPLPTLPAHLGLAGAVTLWVGPEGGPPL